MRKTNRKIKKTPAPINYVNDARPYIILAAAGIIFIISLANIFDNNQRGVIGFIFIASGCLLTAIISLYSTKSGKGLATASNFFVASLCIGLILAFALP